MLPMFALDYDSLKKLAEYNRKISEVIDKEGYIPEDTAAGAEPIYLPYLGIGIHPLTLFLINRRFGKILYGENPDRIEIIERENGSEIFNIKTDGFGNIIDVIRVEDKEIREFLNGNREKNPEEIFSTVSELVRDKFGFKPGYIVNIPKNIKNNTVNDTGDDNKKKDPENDYNGNGALRADGSYYPVRSDYSEATALAETGGPEGPEGKPYFLGKLSDILNRFRTVADLIIGRNGIEVYPLPPLWEFISGIYNSYPVYFGDIHKSITIGSKRKLTFTIADKNGYFTLILDPIFDYPSAEKRGKKGTDKDRTLRDYAVFMDVPFPFGTPRGLTEKLMGVYLPDPELGISDRLSEEERKNLINKLLKTDAGPYTEISPPVLEKIADKINERFGDAVNIIMDAGPIMLLTEAAVYRTFPLGYGDRAHILSIAASIISNSTGGFLIRPESPPVSGKIRYLLRNFGIHINIPRLIYPILPDLLVIAIGEITGWNDFAVLFGPDPGFDAGKNGDGDISENIREVIRSSEALIFGSADGGIPLPKEKIRTADLLPEPDEVIGAIPEIIYEEREISTYYGKKYSLYERLSKIMPEIFPPSEAGKMKGNTDGRRTANPVPLPKRTPNPSELEIIRKTVVSHKEGVAVILSAYLKRIAAGLVKYGVKHVKKEDKEEKKYVAPYLPVVYINKDRLGKITETVTEVYTGKKVGVGILGKTIKLIFDRGTITIYPRFRLYSNLTEMGTTRLLKILGNILFEMREF